MSMSQFTYISRVVSGVFMYIHNDIFGVWGTAFHGQEVPKSSL